MDGRYQTGNRVTEESGPALLGRGAELNAVNGVLRRTTPERGTLLVGEPGIGKTTIWEVGIAAAQTQGMLVLTSRAAAAEADFSFTALADHLDGLGPDVLGTLPAPRGSRRWMACKLCTTAQRRRSKRFLRLPLGEQIVGHTRFRGIHCGDADGTDQPRIQVPQDMPLIAIKPMAPALSTMPHLPIFHADSSIMTVAYVTLATGAVHGDDGWDAHQ